MPDDKIELSPDTLLRNCKQQPIGAALAAPLSERLDALVELADKEAAHTSRREMIAALVLNAPASAVDLAAAVFKYRKATAADVTVPGRTVADALELRHHPPGPRRRKL